MSSEEEIDDAVRMAGIIRRTSDMKNPNLTELDSENLFDESGNLILDESDYRYVNKSRTDNECVTLYLTNKTDREVVIFTGVIYKSGQALIPAPNPQKTEEEDTRKKQDHLVNIIREAAAYETRNEMRLENGAITPMLTNKITSMKDDSSHVRLISLYAQCRLQANALHVELQSKIKTIVHGDTFTIDFDMSDARNWLKDKKNKSHPRYARLKRDYHFYIMLTEGCETLLPPLTPDNSNSPSPPSVQRLIAFFEKYQGWVNAIKERTNFAKSLFSPSHPAIKFWENHIKPAKKALAKEKPEVKNMHSYL
jgi:hypothetical protein